MNASITDVVEELKGRTGGYMDRSDAITGEDRPLSIQSCVAWAVRQLGGTTAQLRSVTNEEIAATDESVDALLDMSELRILETVQTNLADVTVKAGPVSEDWNDLSSRIAQLISMKRKSIAMQYGIVLDYEMAEGQLKNTFIRNL